MTSPQGAASGTAQHQNLITRLSDARRETKRSQDQSRKTARALARLEEELKRYGINLEVVEG